MKRYSPDLDRDDYAYSSLPGKNYIRLIELQPRHVFGDTVVCALRTVSLAAAPAYEALSYTWGGQERRCLLICNEKRLLISENLRDALLKRCHFYKDENVFIWADAVCINQEDLAERGEQVSIMRSIYVTASKVIIWLGQENKQGEARAAKQAAGQIAKACVASGAPHLVDSDRYFFRALSHYDNLAKGVEIIPENWQDLLALAALFRLPWFSRVWVVQEVTANRKVVMQYGNEIIDWWEVAIAADWIVTNAKYETEEFAHFNFHGVSNVDIMCTPDLTPLGVLGLLGYTRWFEATDPRDKVFGLLGLFQSSKSPLSTENDMSKWIYPDYTRSTKDVFREIALKSIEISRKVAVLSFVHHSSTMDPEFPSWVPRWDYDSNMRLFHQMRLRTTHWNLTTVARTAIVRDDALIINGYIWGTVVCTSEAMSKEFFNHESESGPLLQPILSLLRLQFSLFTTSFPIAPDYPTGEPLSDVLMLTLTANQRLPLSERVSPDSGGDKETKELAQYRADFTAYQESLLLSNHPDLTLHLTASQQRTLLAELAERRDSHPTLGGDGNRFRVLARSACNERKMFTLDNGFLGLGPETMAVGDVIGVLEGGGVFLLRNAQKTVERPLPVKETGRMWILVGEAYVHGLTTERIVMGIEGEYLHVGNNKFLTEKLVLV